MNTDKEPKSRLIGVVLTSIGSLICFGISGYCLIHSITGWGWFLFVGILCAGAGTGSFTSDKD